MKLSRFILTLFALLSAAVVAAQDEKDAIPLEEVRRWLTTKMTLTLKILMISKMLKMARTVNAVPSMLIVYFMHGAVFSHTTTGLPDNVNAHLPALVGIPIIAATTGTRLSVSITNFVTCVVPMIKSVMLESLPRLFR